MSIHCTRPCSQLLCLLVMYNSYTMPHHNAIQPTPSYNRIKMLYQPQATGPGGITAWWPGAHGHAMAVGHQVGGQQHSAGGYTGLVTVLSGATSPCLLVEPPYLTATLLHHAKGLSPLPWPMAHGWNTSQCQNIFTFIVRDNTTS